jgi:hypothetical protein
MMQKWQHRMALYRRKPNAQHALIDCSKSELPMNDVDEVETKLGLTRFIKAAGEKGWEFCSVIAPWPKGDSLGVENEDGTRGEDEVVEDRLDIQWLIFKRPMP